VHLRDNDISKVVLPTIAAGGVDTVYVCCVVWCDAQPRYPHYDSCHGVGI